MCSLLKKQGFSPSMITTDKLRSYGVAFSGLGLSAKHEQGLRRNNRAEVSNQPNRQREQKMQRGVPPVWWTFRGLHLKADFGSAFHSLWVTDIRGRNGAVRGCTNLR